MNNQHWNWNRQFQSTPADVNQPNSNLRQYQRQYQSKQVQRLLDQQFGFINCQNQWEVGQYLTHNDNLQGLSSNRNLNGLRNQEYPLIQQTNNYNSTDRITEEFFALKNKKIKLISVIENKQATQQSTQDNGSTQNPQQYIYQVEGQGNVDKKLKFILLLWKIMPIYITQANNHNIQINSDPNLSQFQITSQNSNLAQQYLQYLNTEFDYWKIIFKSFNSIQTVDTLVMILNQNDMITKLNDVLEVKNLIVYSSNELDQFCQKENIEFEKQWQNTIYAFVQSQSQDLQQKFTQFIESPLYIKQINFNQSFDLSYQPNMNNIRTQIENLDRQGIQIFIRDPRKSNNQYVVDVNYILWCSATIQESDLVVEKQNQIKIQIEDILKPKLFIQLNQDKTDIWINYLKNQYDNSENEIKVETKSNLESNTLQINLVGDDIDKCKRMLEQIKQELNSINSQELDIIYIQNVEQEQFEDKKQIINILQQQQQKELLFKRQLEIIESKYANLRIRVYKILEQQNTIQFKINFKDNLTIDQIKTILLEQLIQEIQLFTIKINFQSFLEYIKLNTCTFQETYAMIVSGKDDEMTFISTKQYANVVQDLIKQFQLTQQQIISKTLHFTSNLVAEKLKQIIDSKELKLPEGLQLTYSGNIIQLDGYKDSLLDFEEIIISKYQQLQKQLIRKKLVLSEKEAIFFINRILPFIIEQSGYEINLISNEKIECEIDTIFQKDCIVSTLSYEGKELSIAYTDIAKFECDAIVNICNSRMSKKQLNAWQRKIFEMGGSNFGKFCKAQISQHGSLYFGKPITYKWPDLNNGVQNYIINVSNQGKRIKNAQTILKQNIKQIFIEANKINIKTLAFPIFGEPQDLLNNIINNLYSVENQTVQTVYLRELSESKISETYQVLKMIIESKQIRQIKHQWQQEKQNQFKNYDDEDINRQIDEGFEQFTNQRQTHEVKLVYPFTKQPGTHKVNLKTMIIKDIALQSTIQLSLQTVNGNKRFLFDNQQIEDVLNEYLMLQQLNKNYEFQIFYKRHKIIFNSDGTIQQLNEATGFSRQVKHISYKQNQQQKNQNILTGKNVKLELHNQSQQPLNIQSVPEIIIESFNMKVIENLQKKIEDQINKDQMDLPIQIPLMNEYNFECLKKFILKNSNSIKDNQDIVNGQSLTIRIFKENQQMIQAEINQATIDSMKFPIDWSQQEGHFLKVDLPINSEEYKKIQSEFTKTDKGVIHKIYRLQNKELWQSYQFEKQKLAKIVSNTQLTQLEEERYLWHGVQKKHPKIIYESMKEAFDMTYSNIGMWGAGMYFAERADYSRDYSYMLQPQDDPDYAGKLVFLCCKVATGKVQKDTKPNQVIKRPSEGYNCVSGFTNSRCTVSKGSDVFILYGMDVRRAYPAYEVIFS